MSGRTKSFVRFSREQREAQAAAAKAEGIPWCEWALRAVELRLAIGYVQSGALDAIPAHLWPGMDGEVLPAEELADIVRAIGMLGARRRA